VNAAPSSTSHTPRILHVPADVGGHAFGLSRAERELGLHSDVAVLTAGPFGYEADIRVDLHGRSRWAQLGARGRMLGRAVRSYDLIHFNFGQSLVPIWFGDRLVNELPLLRAAGKTIFVTFQGCDVRPQRCCFCTKEHCRAETPRRLPNAERFLRYADRCFHLNPDLSRWLPGSRFLPYASVDPGQLTPQPARPDGEQVVVAHAPTDREVKGTAHVIAAVEQLQREGVPIRLELLEGMPRSELLARLQAADLVVDQLLIGWYGGFAVEAMALGKPVLCHVEESDAAGADLVAELPIVRATPATIAERLRELAGEREAWGRIGAASRAFVERHHDPRAVAREALAGYFEPAASDLRAPA
jgi:glycosyltransferase involved in cell wall biosynthesis